MGKLFYPIWRKIKSCVLISNKALIFVELILGPDTWYSLGYDTCGPSSASTQSPVDLVATDFTNDFRPLVFSTNWWDDIDGEIFNNGHTGNWPSKSSRSN